MEKNSIVNLNVTKFDMATPIGLQYHRIIPAERELWSLQSNLLLTAEPALRSDLARGFVQLGLENFHGWRLRSFSGHPVPLLGCPQGPKGFPYIQSERLLFQFMATISCPLTVQQCQEPISISSMGSLKVLRGCSKVSLKTSLLQAEPVLVLQLLLTGQALQPPLPPPQCLGVSLLKSFQLAEILLALRPWIPPYSGTVFDDRDVLLLCPVSILEIPQGSTSYNSSQPGNQKSSMIMCWSKHCMDWRLIQLAYKVLYRCRFSLWLPTYSLIFSFPGIVVQLKY